MTFEDTVSQVSSSSKKQKKKKMKEMDAEIEKKKKKVKTTNAEVNGDDSSELKGGKKKEKKRKVNDGEDVDKDTSLCEAVPLIQTTEGVDSVCDDVSTVQKHKKKKKRKHLENDDSGIVHKKQKSDNRTEKESCLAKVETNNSEVDSVKKKKRKNLKCGETNDNELFQADINSETTQGDSVLSETKLKKKKKKKSKNPVEEQEVSDAVAAVDCGESEVVSKKKKKKKKRKNEVEEIPGETVEKLMAEEDDQASDVLADTDKKKRKKNKKKKKEQELESTDQAINEEVVESNVKNNKRKIESESNYQKDPASPKDGDGPVIGQWKGDLFESEERQSKFLRLLGGMKKPSDNTKATSLFSASKATKGKGLFGSLGGANNKSGNVALSMGAAESLNKSLEEDYNRALGLRLGPGRGKGFGFVPDPAEGKKFHIDTKAVKSKVFDD